MEKDIKILEEMLKTRKEQKEIIECAGGYCGNCNQDIKALESAIQTIKTYKELEEKWDKDIHKLQNALDLANADKINNYTPKSKIKETIEEFKLKIEKYYEHKIQGKETDVEFYENITNIEIVRVLQELLEGK